MSITAIIIQNCWKQKNNKEASIIRYLSKIRTELFKHFRDVDNEMVYNLSNLDRMSFFDKKEIDQLYKWDVSVIQANYRADKYVLHITRLLDKNIDACKKLFPESIRFDYIKTLFVVPKYERKGVLIKEYEKFKGKRKLYPFQMYIYWEPDAYGNPTANYLVLYENSKCGKEIKEALTQKSIFHCAMDDFYMENAKNLQNIVLKKTLESYLPSVVGESAWELTKQIYADAYIQTSEEKMKRFCDKYIKNLRLKIDENGRFRVAIIE